MASTVLDVRSFAAAPVGRTLRRPPVPALAAGLIAVLEAVGLLAVGLTQVDDVLASPVRPPGWAVVVGLLGLAGWIVLSAGGGAALVEGTGRRLVVHTATAELLLVCLVGTVAALIPLPGWLAGEISLPLAFALAFAVPVGKLLLVDARSAREWVRQGPRVRSARPDPVTRYRWLCTVTLGGIALGLGALAVLGPAAPAPAGPVPGVVSGP